jgi:hypothetical protein
MPKLHPYELRLQSKCITDRDKGEKPARVIAEKPILSLPRALHKPPLLFKLLLKTQEGIFEYRIHQRRLRAHFSEFDPRVEELLWQYADIGPSIIPGVPVCRRRLR